MLAEFSLSKSQSLARTVACNDHCKFYLAYRTYVLLFYVLHTFRVGRFEGDLIHNIRIVQVKGVTKTRLFFLKSE